MSAQRLILGTAQLGMAYGVANASGRPDRGEALALVRAAWQGGVRGFDTAQAYGESEAVLGNCLRELGISDQARITSKLDPGLDSADPAALLEAARASLKRLGADRLAGLLLHSESLLDAWDQGLGESLARVREAGLAERLGVSVYSPEAALRALETDGLDLVQLPANALDRRFEAAGVFDLAARKGKALHLRSVFLQGLLLMDPDELPEGLETARPLVQRFRDLAGSLGTTPAGLALGYVREAHPGCNVLFGAEQARQVADNLRLWGTPLPEGAVDETRRIFAQVPETILNPSLWETHHAA